MLTEEKIIVTAHTGYMAVSDAKDLPEYAMYCSNLLGRVFTPVDMYNTDVINRLKDLSYNDFKNLVEKDQLPDEKFFTQKLFTDPVETDVDASAQVIETE